MKPEAQRIAIAKACGTLSSFYCGHCRETRNEEQRRQIDGVWFCNFCAKTPLHHDSPNYPEDLNAIQKAWETLNDGQRWNFRAILIWVCARTTSWYEGATAAQRCEAFLRTLGLWEE